MKALKLLTVFLLVSSFAFTSCKKDEEDENNPQQEEINLPKVTLNGTTIYVHPVDNAKKVKWGNYMFEGAFSTTDGKANTAEIVADIGEGDYAAYLCDTLTAHGYSDWYLPSVNELNVLYENQEEIGGFTSMARYWSSTADDDDDINAISMYFTSGFQLGQSRNQRFRVRCVRR